jgi:diguanylate cyclase (GGDEF)-like protein
LTSERHHGKFVAHIESGEAFLRAEVRCAYACEQAFFKVIMMKITRFSQISLRAAVEAQPFDINADMPVRITASIGIASWPGQVGSAQELVAAADAAMYAAKQGGRNRVVEYAARLVGGA